MKPQPSSEASALRRAAEARLKKKPAAHPPKGQADPLQLQRELEVHQIELEMRNEELRKAQAEIAADLERFTDLYDFAPVGYFTLTPDGTIRLVNLTGATLVGVERSRLVGRRLGLLVAVGDRRKFRDFLVQVFGREVKLSCELTLAVEGRAPLSVRIEATVSPDGKECRAVLMDVTERARADANLATSERRLRAIFDTEPECVKLLAPDGSLLEMNPAGLRMIEADSFRQVEHQCVYPLVVEEHRAAFRALNEQVFAGEAGTLEFQIVGLKGRRRWLETNASPLRDATGRVTALLGITRDITAHKRAEQRLAAFATLGRRLNVARDATEAARIIVGIADELFGWDACKLDRYNAQTDRSHPILIVDIAHGQRQELPVDSAGVSPSPRLRRLLQGEPELILRAEPLAVAPDRAPFGNVSRPSASIMAVPLREGGEVVGALSVHSYRLNAYTRDDLNALQDLADHCAGALKRIASEAAQRASEERLRLAVHASNIGLWDWDIGTNQVTYSREWKSQLGYAEHEIGNAFSEWESRVHPDDLAPTLERVRQSLVARGGVHEVEFRMRHKDGSWRWIYTRAEISRDAQGQAVRMVGCHVDITQRKRAEQRQAAFAALGRRLNAASDDTAAARIIADTADELFGWDSCKVDFYDAQTDRSRSILTVDVVNGQRQEFSPALSDSEPSPRLRKVITTGALLILRQEPITLSPDSTPFGDKSRPSASIMAVPIREAGEIVGVLAIQSYRLNAYTNADLAALQDLADHCAGALERIRGRTEMQQERNLLRTVVDHLPDFIYVKDLESRFVLFNAASLRLMKLEREEAVLGRTVFDFFPPDQARAFTEDDQRVLASGQPVLDREEPITGQSGQTRHLLTTKVPLCDASGRIVGLVGLSHDITERKQAEEDLRRAEERYHSIFEHAVEGIYQSTPAGRYLTVNPAMADIYGYASPEEMTREITDIGRQLYADPEDRRRLQALLHAQGGTGVFECQMRRRDGTLIWIRQSSRAVRDASGQVICYEGSAEDITERRQAEETLRRQHALLSAVVEGTSDAVFAKDLEGRYLLINTAGALALGRPAAEILGHTDAKFVPEATARRFREADEAVIASGQMQVQEESGLMGGQVRYWHANKAPMRNADGQIMGVIGVSRDVTDRMQSEAALRQSEERFAKAFDASPAAVNIATVHDGRLLNVNERYCQFFGYTREEVIGRTVSELGMWADPAQRAPLKRLLLANRSVRDFEAKLRRKDGTVRDALISMEIIDYPGVSEPVLISMSTDITERKEAAAELVQLSGKLLRAQDEERRRLARELHDSTAQTLAALAMNLAIVTRTTALDAEGRALLAECEAQVKRGTTELRTFAYLLHPPALEALGLARAAQDYAEGFAKRSGIAVTLDVPPEPVRLPPEIELTLFRVLQESLGNLHRHSGSATATLRLTQDAEAVTLEVRDAGRGLDERQLAAARSGGAGLGVGFAGMRERLRLLGGRLELEPGLPGLIVRATLPLAAGNV